MDVYSYAETATVAELYDLLGDAEEEDLLALREILNRRQAEVSLPDGQLVGVMVEGSPDVSAWVVGCVIGPDHGHAQGDVSWPGSCPRCCSAPRPGRRATTGPRTARGSTSSPARSAIACARPSPRTSADVPSRACLVPGCHRLDAIGTACPVHGSSRQTRGRGSSSQSTAFRQAVITAAGGRCEFVHDGGARCSATRNLEAHHVRDVVAGGSNDPAFNGLALCRRHHRMAER